ncbi:TetR/AcrR family transcriptional regulator [Streptomyces sp. NPDC006368]|uniref:TetR/AcrR family transcriptional regulator n=1 Tax=Streptomyces sp. NPDC006368 TaxID=3156760 RepID=UPI0033B8583F
MDAIAAEAGVSKVTVYNHFGSKKALFTAVITGALDETLDDDSSAALARLADTGDADDLRAAFVDAARAWVAAVRANEDVAALRPLVATELHRFPQPGAAWRGHGPAGHHPPWRTPCAPRPTGAAWRSPTWRRRSSSSTRCSSSRTWCSASTARTWTTT